MPRAEPKRTIEAIRQISDAVLLSFSCKGGDDGDHLAVGQTFFRDKLVVSETSIGFPDLDHAMQNKLPVSPLVQRQIIALEASGQRREHHAVPPFLEHGEHTCPTRIDAHRASGGQLCPDQGHHGFQRNVFDRCHTVISKLGFMRGIHFFQGSRQRF